MTARTSSLVQRCVDAPAPMVGLAALTQASADAAVTSSMGVPTRRWRLLACAAFQRLCAAMAVSQCSQALDC